MNQDVLNQIASNHCININLVEWLFKNSRLNILNLHKSHPAALRKQGFLTDPRLHRQSWSDLWREGRYREAPAVKWQEWWASGLEEDFVRIYPFRTNKDKAIRLMRARDWWIIYHHNPPPNYSDVLDLGWDYITTLNLLNTIALIPTWYGKMERCGAFDSDLENYVLVAKKLNDRIKMYGLVDEPSIESYVEAATITGYRNPPYPGFDQAKEAKLLAEGGEVFSFPITQYDAMSEKLIVQPESCDGNSFEEWMDSATWTTSGASTFGRLEIQTPEGPIKLKCRKNQILDAITARDLAKQAQLETEQTNYTIVKSELGKIRLAVSSDIYTYLKMAWVLSFVNKGYLKWKHATLSEDVEEQLKRMEDTCNKLVKRFGLPYDYKAFDHQILTKMIQTIWKVLSKIGLANVPETMKKQYTEISNNVHNSFDNATLITRIEQMTIINKITGGLSSGLGITSIVGNAWNLIMTDLMLELHSALGFSKPEDYSIRGDDSSLIFDSWRDASAADACYGAIGAIGGQGKFAVKYQETEFLRVRYTVARCSGYALRALPGLVQRKPWNSQPWSEISTIAHHYNVLMTLKRRGLDVDRMWRGLRGVWCQLHQIPVEALSTPIHLGGLGLCSGSNRVWPQRRVPHNPSHIIRKTTERERLIIEKWNYQPLPTQEQLKNAAQRASDSTLSADDIPGTAKFIRKQTNLELKQHYKIIPRTRELVSIVPAALQITTVDQAVQQLGL